MSEVQFPDTAALQNDSRLLTSIRGVVYDVSSAPEMYGSGASYSVFVGHDITYCLALTSLEKEDLDQPYNNLSEEENQRVMAFEDRFQSKYPRVGRLGTPSKL